VVARPLLRFDVGVTAGRLRRGEESAAVDALSVALSALPDAVVWVDGEPGSAAAELAFVGEVRRVSVAARIERGSLAARLCDAAGDCTELVSESATASERAGEVAARAQAWLRLDPPAESIDVASVAAHGWAQLQRHQGGDLEELAAASPGLAQDPRLSVLIAMAPCFRGRVDVLCLAAIPEPLGDQPAVRRALADAEQEGSEHYVTALAAWARSASAAESAQEARDAALGAGRYEDALAMDDLWRSRGGRGSHDLRRALEAAVGRGEPAVPRASVVQSARRALSAGEARDALALAERALRAEPWQADAWAIKTRALAELGRMSEAHAALVTLERVDPLSSEVVMVRRLLGGGQ